MRFRCWSRGLVLSVVATLGVAITARAADWLSVRDTDLAVQPGSVLDFSAMVEAGPAGKYGAAVVLPNGHIGFENRRTAQRFFCASFAFSPASGGFPDKDRAALVVTQLVRTGYNAVRLQNVDANLMSGRRADFDFDPEQLDRFQYFLAQLKAAGIYVLMDVLYLDAGAYGNVFPHRWVRTSHRLRRDLYVDAGARAHWLRLLRGMLGRVNPYTQTIPLQDPGLLGLILVNEGGIAELAYRENSAFDKPYPEQYALPFREWLRTRYKTDAGLSSAWGAEKKAGESLTGSISVPQVLRGSDPRSRDFMRFATDLEMETFSWMLAQARDAGFRGLATAFNNWDYLQSALSRRAAHFVDVHGYHALPSAFADPGSQILQTSALDNAARFVRQMASSRLWGKPLTVSEYGQPFWNVWRRESVALAAGYAALQDWDLITQFAENPVQLAYGPSLYGRFNAIHPFGVATDPILRTGERLAALLFHRRDVRASSSRLRVALDPERLFQEGAGWEQLQLGLGRLSLVTGFGIDFEKPAATVGSRDLVVEPSIGGGPLRMLADRAVARLGFSGQEARVFDLLKAKGLVPKDNGTDLGLGVYQSDTGELLLHARERRFSIDTPRTDVAAFVDGVLTSGALTVSNPSVPVLVAVSSMDAHPVESSRHLLLMVLSDAQNSGMEFADDSRRTLRRLGRLPVQLLRVRTGIDVANQSGGTWQAFALSLAGQRREQVAVAQTGGGIHVDLDTGALSEGPSTLFELIRQ